MKYLVVLISFIYLIGCGANVSVDKIEAEAEIDHKIRFDLSNIERYFSSKCYDELVEEYGYEPTEKQVNHCVNLKMSEFITITTELTGE